MKFRPIRPNEQNITAYRKALTNLVDRMAMDFEKRLKPIIIKMSAESRRRASYSKLIIREKTKTNDALRFLEIKEVAAILNITTTKVMNDLRGGLIKGFIFSPDGKSFLIPETSVRPYGIAIGKIQVENESLADQFLSSIADLQREYDDLSYLYGRAGRKFINVTYLDARNKFRKQFEEKVGIDVLKGLAERGLKEAAELEIANNVNLIKSIPKIYFSRLQEMVTMSVTGGRHYEGGLIKAIIDMTNVTRKQAKLIARDQSNKAVTTFNRLRYENLGSTEYIWHTVRDRRVSGTPNGIYKVPAYAKNFYKGMTADEIIKLDTNKYHGLHYYRDGVRFKWNNPPADGHAGMGIQCRCFSEPIFPDFE